MKGFNYIEGGPTADLTVEAKGTTLEEAFKNCALAMFNAITPLEGVDPKESRDIEVQGEDLELLLFNFLDELLYIYDVELMIFSDIKLEIDRNSNSITSKCFGESFKLKKHQQGIVIKAVTFHKMKVEKKERCWSIIVVFDT
jgi:SHS2 domain-containing protein